MDLTRSNRSSRVSALAPLLRVNGISKSFGVTQALDDVSFTIARGEVHALLGHNGAGKSTLISVLAGLRRPDGGTIEIDSTVVSIRSAGDAQSLGIAHVSQELSLVGSLSVEDNLLLGDRQVGMKRRESPARRRADATLLESLGVNVPLASKIRNLAIGERQLVEIARGLRRGARLLILDEPTATLSQFECLRVFTAIERFVDEGGSVLYVSHRLGEVIDMCDRASIMRDGRLLSTETIKNHDRASLVALLAPDDESSKASTAGCRALDGRPVGVIRGLAVPGKLQPMSLEVRTGEIVGFAGHVGSGASTVLRAMAGLESEATGEVTVNTARVKLASPVRSSARGIWYTTNDRKRDGLFLGRSVRENLLAKRLRVVSKVGIVSRQASQTVVLGLCAELAVDVSRAGALVSNFSGGNQQKVLIGRYLRLPGTGILCLDEPTRGVDVSGRKDIHQLMRDAADTGNGVLFASTELDEIMDVADVIVTFFAGQVIRVVARSNTAPAQVFSDISHG